MNLPFLSLKLAMLLVSQGKDSHILVRKEEVLRSWFC